MGETSWLLLLCRSKPGTLQHVSLRFGHMAAVLRNTPAANSKCQISTYPKFVTAWPSTSVDAAQSLSCGYVQKFEEHKLKVRHLASLLFSVGPREVHSILSSLGLADKTKHSSEAVKPSLIAIAAQVLAGQGSLHGRFHLHRIQPGESCPGLAKQRERDNGRKTKAGMLTPKPQGLVSENCAQDKRG